MVMGRKNKELLFLISKKKLELSPSILVTKNPKRSQCLDKGTNYVYGEHITPNTTYQR
jgi:hypothetical protein